MAVVYVALLATSDDPATATTAPCESGTAVADPSANPGLVSDCATLLELKDELRGTGSLNWSADVAMSAWTGVTVGGTPRRVTELRLSSSGLTGTVPARLGDLRALRALDLSSNTLTGSISEELGSLSELVFLSLHDNSLTGSIPATLGDLGKLRWLLLYGNTLTGGIPRSWGRCGRCKGSTWTATG